MPQFEVHGCRVVVAKGGRVAVAVRDELRDSRGNIVQVSAGAAFVSTDVSAEVQAVRWAKELAAIFEADTQLEEPI